LHSIALAEYEPIGNSISQVNAIFSDPDFFVAAMTRLQGHASPQPIRHVGEQSLNILSSLASRLTARPWPNTTKSLRGAVMESLERLALSCVEAAGFLGRSFHLTLHPSRNRCVKLFYPPRKLIGCTHA
jgi:hypothetical protein